MILRLEFWDILKPGLILKECTWIRFLLACFSCRWGGGCSASYYYIGPMSRHQCIYQPADTVFSSLFILEVSVSTFTPVLLCTTCHGPSWLFFLFLPLSVPKKWSFYPKAVFWVVPPFLDVTIFFFKVSVLLPVLYAFWFWFLTSFLIRLLAKIIKGFIHVLMGTGRDTLRSPHNSYWINWFYPKCRPYSLSATSYILLELK